MTIALKSLQSSTDTSCVLHLSGFWSDLDTFLELEAYTILMQFTLWHFRAGAGAGAGAKIKIRIVWLRENNIFGWSWDGKQSQNKSCTQI